MKGYKVAYFNLQKLLIKIKMARVEGTIIKFFEKIAKTDLLILDDFSLTPLGQQYCLDLMELIEDRHARRATIIASQLPVASWYDLFAEETIADAVLDRLIHTSHRVELTGESLRKNCNVVIDVRSLNSKTKGGQYARNGGSVSPEYPEKSQWSHF